VLGFKLMENFNTPYYSRSIGEFWHRWHISLSTWFRDYLYFPMGGNRVALGRWCFNIIVTFAVSGLWHGANWTYLVWGLLNGVYLLAGRATACGRNRLFGLLALEQGVPLRSAISLVSTFVLACAAWVVFRARNLTDAGYVLSHFFRNWDFGAIKTEHFLLRQLPVAIGALVLLESIQLLNRGMGLAAWVAKAPLLPRWAFYMAFLFVVVMLGVYKNTYFIYFQF
jgi:D-alanyl-lipoteichoic acid acyltransferase DltB (MBOAT superfamily)